MEKVELDEILKLHAKWLVDDRRGQRANLSGANLSNANLSNANLSNANLSGANLSEANLRWADLSDANLSDANLSEADLRWANLSGANLSEANLRWANLSEANLSGANLSEANLSDANLSEANLSGVEGLERPSEALERLGFERSVDGSIFAYKTFDQSYSSPECWKIEPGSILSEVVNQHRQNDCGCGINVATLSWVRNRYPGQEIWRVRIPVDALVDVVVPFGSTGKIRAGLVVVEGVVK